MKKTTYANILKGLSIIGAFILGFFFCKLVFDGIDNLVSIGLIVGAILSSLSLMDTTNNCIPDDER